MRVVKALQIEMTDTVNPNFQPQKTFTASGLMGEEIHQRSMYQCSGFSRILKQNDVLICMVDDDRGTVTAIASEASDRPLLTDQGDTAMYSSDTVYIKIRASGSILIDNGVGTIELKATGQVDINNGNLTIDP